jgi:hypothetical protein
METVRQIRGGWGSFTFLVHGDHILRFARTAEVAVAHHREVALLPVLDADLGAALTRELRHGLAVGDAAIVSEALVSLRGRLSF